MRIDNAIKEGASRTYLYVFLSINCSYISGIKWKKSIYKVYLILLDNFTLKEGFSKVLH